MRDACSPHPGRAVARPFVPLARAVRPCLDEVLARLPGPRRRSSQTPTAPRTVAGQGVERLHPRPER